MQLPYKTSTIHYSDTGKGTTIVLLHGYLETREIWTNFAAELSKTFRVIAIDIPGHGLSGKIANVHTMDLLADAVNEVLASLLVNKALIVGHSMGGYVALSYLANYRSKVLGLCLFHSTPFADTDEKKANRNREIDIIKQGKQEILFNTNIPKGFATDNLGTFNEQVQWAKQVAATCMPDGIIAILEGMKIRTDRQQLLKEANAPILYILGKKDNYIPYNVIIEVAKHPPIGEILSLENSGHMGFIEEPEACINALKTFVICHS